MKMNIKNIHELDLDWEEIYDYFRDFVIPSIGTEKAIEIIIQTAGREKLLKSIFPNATSKQIKKVLTELDGQYKPD